ncbi:hypothetical protein [Deinococcus humi]|uniref:Uncharacterized protein n=1 Tax=Deinococcus humi TaxID=662880 RepID=A0A7W8JTS2_9DEIO|nr:hypothetical protein [Deinococcus humi]MBB5363102.1 hypothetical protein [Deinococcus humi]GGO24684.1 hypothetical protein GCM10008949_13840 [Deinococcus humi]
MALDPTLSTYALAVAAASGLVAAGMHGTTVASSPRPPPIRRVLIAELIRSFVVGAATSEIIRQLPWQWQLLPVLLAAAVVGSTLGPRGIGWLFAGGLGLLRKLVPLLSGIPDAPKPKEVEDADPK